MTLYTNQWGMGKKNKVVKLTDRKIRYIIRAKKRCDSTNKIAKDMKLSPSKRETCLDALDENQEGPKHYEIWKKEKDPG